MRRLIALIFLTLAAPVWGEEIVAAMNQNQVSITTDFSGSEIFIFGAVRADDAQEARVSPLQVVIMVTGPQRAVIVRKKERRWGIWVNTESVRVDAAPSHYTIATTGPLDDILSATDQLRYNIGLERLVRTVGEANGTNDVPAFNEAVVRLRQKAGLYSEDDGQVDFREETLFSTSIALPADLVEGDYNVRIVLARDRVAVGVVDDVIAVRKAGLERWIYTMAHEQSLLYALLALAVALAAGWLASEAFRLLRR
jgi:uncharacterized protein (TIGR02186 family)